MDEEIIEGGIEDNAPMPDDNKDDIEYKKRWKRNLIINILLLVAIIILIVVVVLNKFVITRMEVAGISMQPTLHDGQKVFVNYTKELKRGDIGVFRHGDKMVVKRVIGIEGDTVRIDELGSVYLNGVELVEDYILDGKKIANALPGEVTLKDGEYFVLGDNRCNSVDSEDYGAVSHDNTIGRVLI